MGFVSDNFEEKTVPADGSTTGSYGIWDSFWKVYAWIYRNVNGSPRICIGSTADPNAAALSLVQSNPSELSLGNGGANAYGTLVAANATLTGITRAGAPTVTPQTAGGGITIVYLVVAKLGDGSTAPAGPTGQTTDGAADLTAAASGNTVAWTAVPGAYAYDVYRTTSPTTPSSTGKIATVVGAVTLLDNGLAGDAGTAPVTNLVGGVKLDATAGGALGMWNSITEEITLATGGATSDSVQKLLPANSIIGPIVFRVTTAINNKAAWAAGDGSTPARFLATGSTLTKDTTAVGAAHLSGTVAFYQAAAASLRITTSGGTQNDTGKVRVTVFYLQVFAPTA